MVNFNQEVIDIVKKTHEELQSLRKTREEVNKILSLNLTYHNIRDIIN
jgi:predicted 2-oxoglutarate/Fe(II)-dependent dioxygenase YbiX